MARVTRARIKRMGPPPCPWEMSEGGVLAEGGGAAPPPAEEMHPYIAGIVAGPPPAPPPVITDDSFFYGVVDTELAAAGGPPVGPRWHLAVFGPLPAASSWSLGSGGPGRVGMNAAPAATGAAAAVAGKQSSGAGGGGGSVGPRPGRWGGGSGRCAVCVVQKKGRCGTDTAPAKCLRRHPTVSSSQLQGILEDTDVKPSDSASMDGPATCSAATAGATTATATSGEVRVKTEEGEEDAPAPKKARGAVDAPTGSGDPPASRDDADAAAMEGSVGASGGVQGGDAAVEPSDGGGGGVFVGHAPPRRKRSHASQASADDSLSESSRGTVTSGRSQGVSVGPGGSWGGHGGAAGRERGSERGDGIQQEDASQCQNYSAAPRAMAGNNAPALMRTASEAAVNSPLRVPPGVPSAGGSRRGASNGGAAGSSARRGTNGAAAGHTPHAGTHHSLPPLSRSNSCAATHGDLLGSTHALFGIHQPSPFPSSTPATPVADVVGVDEGLAAQLERLQAAREAHLLDAPVVPDDELLSELLSLQGQLFWQLHANRARCDRLLARVLPRLADEEKEVEAVASRMGQVASYLATMKEAQRKQRKERRDKEAAAAVAAVHAAVAASPRVGHVRRDGSTEVPHLQRAVLAGGGVAMPGSLSGDGGSAGAPGGVTGAARGSAGHMLDDAAMGGDGGGMGDVGPNLAAQLLFENGVPLDSLAVLRGPSGEPLCAVCGGGWSVAGDEMAQCAGCKIHVHAFCYGIPKVSHTALWRCQPCAAQIPSAQVSCALCPVSLGAFKAAETDGADAPPRWAHIFCALWVPETSVENSEQGRVRGVVPPSALGAVPCSLCKWREGVVLKCSYGHCQAAFHPLCARGAGLHMTVKELPGGRFVYRAYCPRHGHLVREKEMGPGPPGTVASTGASSGSGGGVGRPANGAAATGAGASNVSTLRLMRQLRADLGTLRSLCESMVRRERVKRELLATRFELLLTGGADAVQALASATEEPAVAGDGLVGGLLGADLQPGVAGHSGGGSDALYTGITAPAEGPATAVAAAAVSLNASLATATMGGSAANGVQAAGGAATGREIMGGWVMGAGPTGFVAAAGGGSQVVEPAAQDGGVGGDG
eukprot:jgi/Mesvir1/29758/Mv25099-RA.3